MLNTLAPYKLAMNPIPSHLEEAIGKGIIYGDFPCSEAAPQVLLTQTPANQVLRSGNGRALVTCVTDMPQATPVMIDWWFGWHMTATERYKLWHPLAHTWTKAKENREHLNNDRARYIGNVSYVNEYIGNSHKYFAIAFQHAEQFGFNNLDNMGATAICARTSDRMLHSEGGALVHLILPTATGCQMRSGFWLGDISPQWPVVGKLFKPMLNLPLARRLAVTDRMALDLLRHCAEEMNHLARFLPALYEDVHALKN